jgi:hypothetical protein
MNNKTGVIVADFAGSLLVAISIGVGVSFALSGAVVFIAHHSSDDSIAISVARSQ